jgi:hypothetical protein
VSLDDEIDVGRRRPHVRRDLVEERELLCIHVPLVLLEEEDGELLGLRDTER